MKLKKAYQVDCLSWRNSKMQCQHIYLWFKKRSKKSVIFSYIKKKIKLTVLFHNPASVSWISKKIDRYLRSSEFTLAFVIFSWNKDEFHSGLKLIKWDTDRCRHLHEEFWGLLFGGTVILYVPSLFPQIGQTLHLAHPTHTFWVVWGADLYQSQVKICKLNIL